MSFTSNTYVSQCGSSSSSPTPRRSRRGQSSLGKSLPGKSLLAWAVWCGLAVAALIFLSTLLAAPLAAANRYFAISEVIYTAFGHICHQLPERSFHFATYPYAVCARCFGLYAGFAAGVLLQPLVRSINRRATPERIWFIIGALPTAIDFTLGWLGVWENTHLSRSLTGAILGAVSAFFVMPGLVDLSCIVTHKALPIPLTMKE